jgi:PRTRC genetic system protein A
MNIVTAHLAENKELPALDAFYQYVIGAEGLYIRAQDDFLDALVLIAPSDRDLNGVAVLDEYARLRVAKIPSPLLTAARASAKRHLPNEAMYQFTWTAAQRWAVEMPKQTGTPVSLSFEDTPGTILDLHSHGILSAFFSDTDNNDEQGLRLYAVIGKIDTDAPEILCRIGVYGHHLEIPATDIFENIAPFTDLFEVQLTPDSTDTDNDAEEESFLAAQADFEAGVHRLGISETESGILVAHHP